MALFESAQEYSPIINGSRLACIICGEKVFLRREIQLNTAAATFFGFDWANKSATGLICNNCGFVHEFLGEAFELQPIVR